MVRNVKVKLNLKGLNELMRSAPVQAKVNEEAGRIKARAGDKFQVHPSPHRYTARAFVEAKKGKKLTDADRQRLLEALGAAKE
ncbi:hypothetical protein MUN78_10175 [Leucobacter allii]|uniref:Uncharacterized protein n=1 Tax=Leucobacter allii TaxID=2932247 RepID=A0ABY4FHP7_9MICO|nr:hypothetical protein [Leucobacter allii]UOQ56070.1 hypothetical protein MUN78_10175 [Leucobacter allii]